MCGLLKRSGESAWERFFGALIANKLLVFIPIALIAAAGLIASPLGWDLGLPSHPIAVDAIPDTGDNQQIVFTEWPGRSPKDIEDQITYPLTTTLLSVPGVRTVRSQSMFGFSSIYVIFEEGVGFYWARSRILERLSSLPPGSLPDEVSPRLGPEATALGQIFWYTLQGRDADGRVVGGWDRDELRSVQDWTVRYALQGVSGVAEVASIGGFVREYQVDVDPEALRANRVSIEQVARAVKEANQEVGARTLEVNGAEYVIRSRGFIHDVADLEQAVVAAVGDVPVRIADVARVTVGPADRRGALDDAGAEVVGGVVVARYGANPRAVIDAVKARIDEIAPTLPVRVLEDGTTSRVTIAPFYDRTELIEETIDTLGTALRQEILITILVVLVLLGHLRSAALISGLVPLAVLATFLAMRMSGVDANIMSLAGVAIAIGTMVDVGIVMIENIVRRLDEARDPDVDRAAVIRRAAAEVAPAVLTSVLTTIVSFLPVFALTAAEGKLFRPLAFTKTFALGSTVILGMVLLPVLAHMILVRVAPVPADGDAGDTGSGRWLRIWRSITRRAHLVDWLVLCAGVLIAIRIAPLVGVYFIVVGVGRLARPLLTPPLHRIPLVIEIVVGVLLVAIAVARDWAPLGVDRALALNLVFAGGMMAAVLGGFALFQLFYGRILRWCLAHKGTFLMLPSAIATFGFTAWLGFDAVFGWLPGWVAERPIAARAADELPGFGREFMPPLDEGSFLVMPSTMPHASFGQSLALLQQLDASLATVPEVERVVGKLGRVDSALDPAPVSMFETVVTYKPEYSIGPDGRRVRNWRDHIRSPRDIWDELRAAAELPGLTPVSMLMPIETRRLMLQTGMRGTMGLRLRGPDLDSLERAALLLEETLRGVAEVESVSAERVVGKPYLEIEPDREALGRYGLGVGDVQRALSIALGGRPLTRTVEGRERYPVRVRLAREDRDSPAALARIPITTAAGEHIPLGQLARIEYVRGPQVIKSEDTFMTAYITFEPAEGVSEVRAARAVQDLLDRQVESGTLHLPVGITYELAGSYEEQVRAEERLTLLVPLALALVLFLLYWQFRRLSTTLIIYTGVAVAVSGGFGLIWLYGQPWFLDFSIAGVSMRSLFGVGTIDMSVAVWVGVIALIGIATDDGVVMATYLDQSVGQGAGQSAKEPVDAEIAESGGDSEIDAGAESGIDASIADIRAGVEAAGKRRVRACLMTTATTLLALLPVITSQGRGADVMVPMAIPIAGGMVIELITLFVVPVLYCLAAELRHRRTRR